MPLVPGTKLGPYEIVSPLGAGGMGEVYRARDTRLERTVAVKILPEQLSKDPIRKQRFEREAKTISSLNHPNICTLHDIGSQDGVDYLVMECVEGETLAKRLEKGALPLEQVLKYGGQIADALDKAHRAGIVHRDLKPGNIMLTATGAKLLDFGLAKPAAPLVSGATLTAAVPTTPVTQEGTVVGTFQYMSPEQVEGKEVDGRSDIFSLGAVLYEALTGQRAFQGKSHLSVASAILEKEPVPISTVKPMTPSTLGHAIRRCLSKDPEERWQTARDLALELKWVAEAGVESGIASALDAKRPTSWIAVGLAVAAVGALGLAGWALWRLGASSEKRVVRFTVALPANQPAVTSDSALAMSPDGRRMALVVLQSGRSQVALRDLSSLEVKLIPGTEGASAPFFSPDGEWLGFRADGKLKKILVSGGTAIVLANVQSFTGGTWLADGTIVFTPDFREGMYRIPASGGKPELLTSPEQGKEQDWQWWPEALPSGDILFTRKTGEGAEEGSVAVLSMKTRKWTTLLEKATDAHYSPSGHILYVSHGDILAVPFDEKQLKVTGTPLPVLQGVQTSGREFAQFAVARNGTLAYVPGAPIGNRNTIVSVDRTGKESVLAAPPQAYEDLALSPDGKLLAMTIIGEQQWSVWIFDLRQKTLNRLTFEGDNRDPLWSADGKRVIYASSRNGRKSLFWKPVNGPGGEEELVSVASQPFPDSVSKDGRYLAYNILGARESEGYYLLGLQGEKKSELLFTEPSSGTAVAAISPDGRWIAYASAESGTQEVYVRRFGASAGKWQASTEGAYQPSWSADSRELFYRGSDNRISSVTVSPGNDFAPSTPRPLFPFPCISGGHDYAPTADGQHFVCIKQPESEWRAMQVSVVINWASELKGK
ncbi:MAG TPA: protein kinase [Candidatus Acidoferrum sp.]|nr:protein kinase [Candidatus Acidoferrum sp.]